jgi:hypothetical protein
MSEEFFRQLLTDVESNLQIPAWTLRSRDLEPGSPVAWSVEKDVLHGGRQEGVDRIVVDNGALSFTVIPTRGMNLWEARCGDLRLGWDSPVREIVHPQYVHLSERGGMGWLEGFGEWISRCGLASNGPPGEDRVRNDSGALVPVPLTLHGKISNVPARRVEVALECLGDGPPVIKVRGVVNETMMFGTQLQLTTEISAAVGSRTLTITDEIRNLAATPQEFQVLYHTNFGPPLLGAGAKLIAPAVRVTPRDARAADGLQAWSHYGPPQAGYAEQVYFLELAADGRGETEVLLANPTGDRGVSLRFSARELRCFTLWKNTGALADGYVTGIEPGTNFPNHRSFERRHGRVPVLEGGASFRATLSLTAHVGARDVAAAEEQIQKIQGGAATRLEPQPVAELCP